MFKRIDEKFSNPVNVWVEGNAVSVPAGSHVVAAVFAAGFDHTRISAISGQHRSPYCLMGVCFECLVEIDGIPNQQACQTVVREGMQIEIQRGLRNL